MRLLRMSCVILGLSGCALQPKKPAPPPPPPPKPIHKMAPPDTSACRKSCQTQLLSCQDTPDACDQRYSNCLSRC